MKKLRSTAAGLLDHAAEAELLLTSGPLAMINLQAQIDGLKSQFMTGLVTLSNEVALIELIALRGYLCGMIADYEVAEESADGLCCSHPKEGDAYLARARSRARFHLFAEAMTDLDQAEQLGANRESVARERSTIFQAQGKYDAALELLTGATRSRRDFDSLGALAVLHAERNDCAAAEKCFNESLDSYRGVSPIPLAILEFQRGHMWMSEGDLRRACHWFQTAVNRLPVFAPAQGHLAEVEAMCGDTESAIERLMPLAIRCDDPDYAATLALILSQTSRVEEASSWRFKAKAGYDDLVSRHCEAFADHAALFLLEHGGDPHRALGLAKRNLEIRCTPRAQKLVGRATCACEIATSRAETKSG